MIFVTVGTHPGDFSRLVRRIDEIAPFLKERVVIQKGYTKYEPKNCEYFSFTDSIDPYFKKSRLVISHSATSILELIFNYKKPLITVPRQKKFGEHINDHQVEFADFAEKSLGIKKIIEIKELSVELIKNYRKVPKVDKTNLLTLQKYFMELFRNG